MNVAEIMENRSNNVKQSGAQSSTHSNRASNSRTPSSTNEHKHPNQYTKGADDEGAKNSKTIDSKSANDILRGFNGKDYRWEDRWLVTEDNLLLRSQIRLGDYNIMLAWAEYVPDMTIRVDKNPPAGQYQPADGQEDYFWRLTFDFPLIDWNRRYRGVQAARMKKAQAFHELSRKRTDYSNTWLQCEQRVALAETNRRLAKVHFETAEMRYKEARISFETGLGDMPAIQSGMDVRRQPLAGTLPGPSCHGD